MCARWPPPRADRTHDHRGTQWRSNAQNAAASAFGRFGVPGPGIKDQPAIWETFISVDRIRAVDATPHLSYEWSRFRPQPNLVGSVYRLEESTQEVQPVQLDSQFSSWDEWLAVLSVRCGWAHELCAPAEVNALYAAMF